MPTNKTDPGDSDAGLLQGWFLSTATILLISVCLHQNHRFFHDDTYITLRYARHILQGFGPVWNPHGERVEGFTSPLHLLLVTAAGGFGVALPIAARLVNFLSHIAVMVFVYLYLRERTNPFAARLGGMLIACSWMFIVWDLGGLDAVLYAALATIGILTGVRWFDPEEPNPLRCLSTGAIVLSFAVLARPEGVLPLVALWALVFLLPRGKSLSRRVQAAALFAGLAIVVLAPVEIFRVVYYHSPAPNTMYAKLGGIHETELLQLGMRYLWRFLLTPPFVGPLAVVAGLYCCVKHRFRTVDLALWLLIGATALFPVVSGGDHMPAYRFCLVLVPLAATTTMLHLYRIGVLDTSGGRAGVTVVLLGCLALQVHVTTLTPRIMDPAAQVGRTVGEYVNTHWRQGATVALNTAGSTPFYADNFQYIDMLGLNDRQIARRKDIPESGPWTRIIGHLKGDGRNVLSRHPDYIILGPAEGTTPLQPGPIYFIGDYEIGKSPEFRQQYQLCSVLLPSGKTFRYYRRLGDEGRSCP